MLGLADYAALLGELEAHNAEELGKLDEWLEEACKREDETEISQALKARANSARGLWHTSIGDKDKALEAQALALDKTPGLRSRIDIVLTILRILVSGFPLPFAIRVWISTNSPSTSPSAFLYFWPSNGGRPGMFRVYF
ncbi:hypothetical protein FA15DRAFT_711658 [Coprinopsis marcescibilis]|uniref:26S proteasome regulatory subunit Rpn7 N-terminal domain-containing protein n=1 Tax=Coprinopsis marcescibilis TaxID=230819 RepID=A0A5C3K956_COPMA|nr:hypothetical protein FA15DRAFT_711658 [Coprinopsis marcescibilis]